MKKLLIAVSVMLLTMGAASAQNSFRGIVKYQLESTGKVDVKIPAEQSIVEVKVYDNQIRLGQTTQNGFKVAQAADFSPYISYLAANGIDLETYTGDGKFLIRDGTAKEKRDSGYIVDKEPGHYYYENVDETQEMLGYTAHKLIMHRYDEEGNDNPAICWYTTEIGPEYCLVLGAIKGFPLVYTQELGEGRAITYTATEIVKGKVKETDMLLPAGYKDASGEEFETFQREMQEAFELLGD
jgi:hypothetical protein